MKIISIEHIEGAGLVEDDLYLPGHLEREAIERDMLENGGLLLTLHTGAAFDGEVTRLNIDRRTWTHGLRSTYGSGCRCPTCTAAQRDYMRGYSSDRRAADRAEREPVEA